MGKSRSTGKRLTGTSMSAFGFGAGFSTAPAATDRDIVQALVTFLEDKRALFNPEYLEIEDQVGHSVLNIRAQLTEALQQIDQASPAVQPLRDMRAACRRYLDEPRQHFRFLERHHGHHEARPGFFVALGELRATFGAELKRLDALYSLDVEPQLRALFPMDDKA